MKHYYFKFGNKNKGLEKWWEKNESKDKVELSIYYDEQDLKWKTHDFETAIAYYEEKKRSKSAKQIKLFFELQHNVYDSYFWIFYKVSFKRTLCE